MDAVYNQVSLHTLHTRTFLHIHVLRAQSVLISNVPISIPKVTRKQQTTMHTTLLSNKALSLDAQAKFAAMYLSRPPCCHAAVVQSTHYLVSCDSISESFGPGS